MTIEDAKTLLTITPQGENNQYKAWLRGSFMSMEIIVHAVALDLPWVIGLVIGNPFNLFILAVLYVFAYGPGKKNLLGFLKFAIFFISISASMQLLGFPFLATSMPVAYMAITIFLDTFPKESIIKRNLGKINVGLLFGAGFFLAGA